MVQAAVGWAVTLENVHRAGADFHDEQNVESAQGDGVEGEEVGGE